MNHVTETLPSSDQPPTELDEDASPSKSIELLSSDSGIGVTPPDTEQHQHQLVALVVESQVFYDDSVTSGAQFDEWQLRTPTELDDAPVFKNALDFDALVSEGDESKQLEPDDEELFRTSSSESQSQSQSGAEESDAAELSPVSSPPPPLAQVRHVDDQPIGIAFTSLVSFLVKLFFFFFFYIQDFF